jgi:FkbM family methyltransferase
MLSRRALGIPCLSVLKALGRTGEAIRVARLCGFSPDVVTIRGHGPTFRMSGADGRDQIPNLIWWHGGEHEPPMPRVLGALARDARVILDVGANTGFYTLLTAACSKAVVHAFEPYPVCRELLLANLRLNPELAARVRYHEAAVGDRTGTAKFYIPVPLADHGLIETSCSLDRDFRAVDHEIDVRVATLDSEFPAEADAPVDLIKIDVEGMESRVVEGARDMLRRRRPWVTIEILDEKYERPLAEAFEGLDYRLVALVPDRLEVRPEFSRSEATDNYLAAPAEKLDHIKRLAESLGLAWFEANEPVLDPA